MAKPKREARLVLQARSGDREALESLLCDIQASLLRYISGIVGRSGAEDVLQNVFLEICRNLKWLRDPELFRPWAYRIASRASFALLKRERRWSNPARRQCPWKNCRILAIHECRNCFRGWPRSWSGFHPPAGRCFSCIMCRTSQSMKRRRYSTSVSERPSPVWPMAYRVFENQWKGANNYDANDGKRSSKSAQSG